MSDLDDVAKVLMAADSGKHDRERLEPFRQKLIGSITCCFGTGCASVPLVLVASGVTHAYIATSLEPEDMAAAVPIVREAGGVVTNLALEEWTITDESILAANPQLHAKLAAHMGLRKGVLPWA